MDLAERYGVSGVPKIVADGVEIVGAYPEDQFVPQVVGGLAPRDAGT